MGPGLSVGHKKQAQLCKYMSIICACLTTKILKLKKVEKTTRPFRYDLNQIPYDYTVEVTNRFKGLDLIECLKHHARSDIVQKTVIKTIPKKKKCKKAKWLSKKALQIAEKRSERHRRKGKIYPFECRVPKNSKER